MMTTVPVLLFTFFFSVLSPISPTASTPAAPRSTSDAWLWQRDVAGVAASIAAFTRFSSGRLHVLAADDAFTQRDQRLPTALRAARVPVVVTARFTALPDVARVVAIVAWWRAAGVDVAAVEIDHDCASAKLADYATWLHELKHALALPNTLPSTLPNTLQNALPVAITALPAWLDHADHRAVFAAVDDVTVQVHAIKAPALFDTATALQVLNARPELRVALPTYAVTLKGGVPIFASPHDVSVVRAAASRVAWFRLPADGDAAAWTWSTVQAVDAGVVADGALTVGLQPHADGAVDVIVANASAVDVPLTDVVLKDAVVADAVAGFRIEPVALGWRLSSTTARFVAPGTSVVVGWARAGPGRTVRASVGTRR